MKNDPLIDKVREVRIRISNQFNNDPKLLVEYYIEEQKKHKDRMMVSDKCEINLYKK